TLLDEPDKKASPAEKIVAAGNDSAVNSLPGKDYDEVFEETYKGDSQEEFRDRVLSWALSWKHPRFGTGIEKLVYQPMRELMDFLRASGFTVFVVTGSNEDFTRAYSRELYGVPENQVIGSESALKYKVIDNRSFVVKQSHQEVATVGPNKPVMIEKHIGKRPVFAAGNGTSDPDMLTYVSDNKRKNFCLLIRHDDPGREYEYYIPKLEELAQKKGFLIVNMKEDWKTIFPE
ncbi:MAG TPA: haloacid dehalogenase-like hydrolase, partial [Bacteroidales bacterium]|nr:haloacid dehalogenase-like hydrolase [Bacteroidales bacterium]